LAEGPPLSVIRAVHAGIGDAGFRALVDAFYRRVESDPLLRPIFPPDLTEGKERQFLFLRQYFGGPEEYNARYGAPQLRRRHAPFPIDRAARDAWIGHMRAAIVETEIPEPHAGVLRDYFERFSLAMINRSEEAPAPRFQPATVRRLPARLLNTLDADEP
jgi:hemoglobin